MVVVEKFGGSQRKRLWCLAGLMLAALLAACAGSLDGSEPTIRPAGSAAACLSPAAGGEPSGR